MKKIYFSLAALLLIIIGHSDAQHIISCGTIEDASAHQNFQLRNAIPDHTKHIITQTQTVPDTIHVIVHVLWSTAPMNISDSLIQAQLDILNEDFQRLNADTVNTPAPFAAIAGKLPIYFALAQIDSLGAPITGIIRTQTTHGPFAFNTYFDMTHTANGGDNPWNTHFLNMYCAESSVGGVGWMGSNILLINYQEFGVSRVGTHEMGHVFGLSHIWGPEQSTGGFVCSSDDGIADTPEQWSPITTNGPFPVFDTCTASGNGIMYMNYMNYNLDFWTNMFSQGQADDMRNSLNTIQNDLINNVTLGNSELAFQKNISIYPNPSNGNFKIITPINSLCAINIFDIQGREIKNIQPSYQNETELNLLPGVYFCSVKSGSYSAFKKIVVQ